MDDAFPVSAPSDDSAVFLQWSRAVFERLPLDSTPWFLEFWSRLVDGTTGPIDPATFPPGVAEAMVLATPESAIISLTANGDRYPLVWRALADRLNMLAQLDFYSQQELQAAVLVTLRLTAYCMVIQRKRLGAGRATQAETTRHLDMLKVMFQDVHEHGSERGFGFRPPPDDHLWAEAWQKGEPNPIAPRYSNQPEHESFNQALYVAWAFKTRPACERLAKLICEQWHPARPVRKSLVERAQQNGTSYDEEKNGAALDGTWMAVAANRENEAQHVRLSGFGWFKNERGRKSEVKPANLRHGTAYFRWWRKEIIRHAEAVLTGAAYPPGPGPLWSSETTDVLPPLESFPLQVRDALKALSQQQRQIYLLHIVCGRGFKSIATELGVRPDNVKVQWKRARAKINRLRD